MRFKIYLFTGLCTLLVVSLIAALFTHRETSPEHKLTQHSLKAHVAFLGSDALEGRLSGSKGEEKAIQYEATVFRKAGLEPAGDHGTFFQSFDIGSETNKRRAHNVLAKLIVGSGKDGMLIVGAHGDHLGRGTMHGSLARGKEQGWIHHGADDNASGVASVLEAATLLGTMKKHGELRGDRDIVFAIWSGEEAGLLGSSHFVKTFMAKTTSKSLRPAIVANINLDMVGHLKEQLVLQGIASSTDWLRLVEKAKQKSDLVLLTQNDPYLPTDSTSFYLHGVPVINFFTGADSRYHTPRDTAETLNYKGLKRITLYLVDLISALEEKPNLMDYQHVAKPAGNPERGFRVYLGTIPDYSSSGILGVKLAGVVKDSPAERAGVRQDDVIVAVAGRAVHDIHDYSHILGTLQVGESVSMMLMRNQAQITLTVMTQDKAQPAY